MELPENIRRLLLSTNHEDRAIATALLEKLPNYKDLFTLTDPSVSSATYLELGEKVSRPVTVVITNKTIYWINTYRVYMWIEEPKGCYWKHSFPDKVITI